MTDKRCFILLGFLVIMFLWPATPCWARYRAIEWTIGSRENYPAYLTSEGVTIAVDPLYTDALAAGVFDRKDMITRGIMPLGIIIYNDNDFPVKVDGLSIELLHEKGGIKTMSPNEVVYRLFQRRTEWINRPIPPMPRSALNENALDDFIDKFMMDRTIGPKSASGGFLYLHIPASEDIVSFLSKALVYIPYIYRLDDGSRMIFFEIGLEAAVGDKMNR
ncbi:MAG TPA: hypothetical protein VLL97_03505 [Acidobacteriota bacterium]|nr:hypothetical protein [Acidobacteriota bacterium]